MMAYCRKKKQTAWISNKLESFNAKLILHIAIFTMLPLFLGFFIYLAFRTESYKFFSWLNAVGLSFPVTSFNEIWLSKSINLPDWVIFSLPQGLWAFSYAFLIVYIWYDSESVLKYIWFTSVVILGVGYEFMRFFGFVWGTFCIQDLWLGSLGMIIGSFFAIVIKKGVKTL